MHFEPRREAWILRGLSGATARFRPTCAPTRNSGGPTVPSMFHSRVSWCRPELRVRVLSIRLLSPRRPGPQAQPPSRQGNVVMRFVSTFGRMHQNRFYSR